MRRQLLPAAGRKPDQLPNSKPPHHDRFRGERENPRGPFRKSGPNAASACSQRQMTMTQFSISITLNPPRVRALPVPVVQSRFARHPTCQICGWKAK